VSSDLYTIQEAAKRSGLSRQSVYKKLDGVLTDYVVMVNSQKMLKKEAIQVLTKNKITGGDVSQLTSKSDMLTRSILDTVELLREQIKKKDEQLATKDLQIANKDEQIKGYQLLLDQQQRLQAAQHAPALPAKSGFWSRFGKKQVI